MGIFSGGHISPEKAVEVVGRRLIAELEAAYERKYGKLRLTAHRDGFYESINCLKEAVNKLRDDEIVEESEKAEGEEAERDSIENEGNSLEWEAEDDSEFEDDI